jgi:uroporphyrinogen decarboxylase-like protein
MNIRERFHATCNFEKPDRPIRWETIGYWTETFARWHKEGLPETVMDNAFTGPDHFGFDKMNWLTIAVGADSEPSFSPLFDVEIIEETDKYILKKDHAGKTIKTHIEGQSGLPQDLDNPVKTMADFEALKWRLDPETPERFSANLDIMINLANSGGDNCYNSAVCCGLFGTYRHLMGLVGMSVLMKREPKLLHAIAENWVYMHETLFKKVREKSIIDYIYFWEDMSYKNGPMISPKAFREFMSPYYKKLIDSLKADTDIRVFGVDSDGNLWTLLELFSEVGINMFLPFEVQAGMDIREVREKFPKMIIWGGIDKMALFDNNEFIEKEVMEKVPPVLKSGGFIPAIDHVIPPEVSLKNYEKFLEIVRGIKY